MKKLDNSLLKRLYYRFRANLEGYRIPFSIMKAKANKLCEIS